MNGTDTYCEDPMSPAYKKLEHNCMVPKENHMGQFPANFCIKMIGTSSEFHDYNIFCKRVIETETWKLVGNRFFLELRQRLLVFLIVSIVIASKRT